MDRRVWARAQAGGGYCGGCDASHAGQEAACAPPPREREIDWLGADVEQLGHQIDAFIKRMDQLAQQQ